MKNYFAWVLVPTVLFLTPLVSLAASLTQAQAESLISVVQASPNTPASAFTSLITAFSNITVAQAESLIGVIQAAPGASANAFVNLLVSFTQDTQTITTTSSSATSAQNSQTYTLSNGATVDAQGNASTAASTTTTSTYSSVPAPLLTAPTCSLTAAKFHTGFGWAVYFSWTTQNATQGYARLTESNFSPIKLEPIAAGHSGENGGSGLSVGWATSTISSTVTGPGGSATCESVVPATDPSL